MPLASLLRPLAVSLFLLLVSFMAPTSGYAQLTPTDSAAVLLRAGQEFEAQEREDVARALYELVAERYGTTPAGVQAATRLAALGGSVDGEASGRIELQVWSTLYGAFLGVAIPGALGADDAAAYGAGLLVGTPAGFLFGRTLAGSRGLTVGQARAITLGGTWGAWQGFGWREVLELGREETCDTFEGQTYCYEEDTAEETLAAMVLGSVTGVATGVVLSRRPISAGVATTVNFGALWGSWFGVGIGVLLDQEEDGLLATTLIGGNAGLVTMALLAPGWNVSRSRARLVSIAGVVGGLAGGGLDLIIQPDDEKVAIAIPLATSIAGLAIGVATTRDSNADRTALSRQDLPVDALLLVDNGRWSLGTPLPYSVRTVRHTPSGLERRVGVGVTWLRASF